MKLPLHSFVDVIQLLPAPAEDGFSMIALPGNAIHIMIHEGQDILMKTSNAVENSMSGNWLCGHLTSKKSFFIPAQSNTAVIKFKPWANSMIFGLNLFDLINEEISLNEFLPAEILSSFDSGLYTIEHKINAVLQHLHQRASEKSLDTGLINIIHQVEACQGKIRVNDLANQTGYSRRNLERKFKDLTGITIKKFIKNRRFQHSVSLINQLDSFTEIAYTCGYFDQSHLISEFKDITGLTPGQFIKNDLPQLYQLK